MRITVVLVLLFVAGCSKDNPNYCVDNMCPDMAQKCTVSEGECVCLDGSCVQCTTTDEHNCTDPRKPQCGADHTCRACRTNEDCGTGACLEDGSCAAETAVIAAAPGGVSTAGCGVPGQPDCSITQAIAELGARNVIRLARGTYMVAGTDGVDFSTKTGTLVARDAILVRSVPNGPLVSVRNNGSLKLVGGILRGPTSADGIRCNTNSKLQIHEVIIEQMGESALETDSCEFTVSRSVLRSNLRGGINMVNTFKVATITNNFVYRNGQGTTSTVAGMTLKLAAGSKVEFNTVVDNTADVGSTSAGGIVCEIASGAPNYDAPYNLVYRNQGGIGNQVQVIGSCTFQGSYQVAAQVDDNSLFLQQPNDPQNPSYRLTSKSPAEVRDHEVAGYACKDLVDFEGDPRPQGTDGKCDVGADEYRIGQ
jgi:hypothetical protein